MEYLRKWIASKRDVVLYEFDSPVKSVEQAVKVSGKPRSDIIKTIILKHRDEEIYVACIITASARVDKKAIQKGVGGKRWRMATTEEIKRILGFPVGGVPPICLGEKVVRYVDPRVLEKDFVIGGGGTTNSLIGLPPHYISDDGATSKVISFG